MLKVIKCHPKSSAERTIIGKYGKQLFLHVNDEALNYRMENVFVNFLPIFPFFIYFSLKILKKGV